MKMVGRVSSPGWGTVVGISEAWRKIPAAGWVVQTCIWQKIGSDAANTNKMVEKRFINICVLPAAIETPR